MPVAVALAGALLAICPVVLLATTPVLAQPWSTVERVSVGSTVTGGNGHARDPSISADGRFVAFYSAATNLADADANALPDVFIHDRVTGVTEKVSGVNPVDGSAGANGISYQPSVSGDGRSVAFISVANNLVDQDTNGSVDVFVHDRETATTERVSVASLVDGGDQASDSSYRPAISANGRFVAFCSRSSDLVANDTNNVADVFVHDRVEHVTERISIASLSAGGTQGNAESYSPAISDTGRFVAFFSAADNLVPGDQNGTFDVFVHDRASGTTTMVSIASLADGGTQGNGPSMDAAISGDGNVVAFVSEADNLVAGDTNDVWDVFVHDLAAGVTERVSMASLAQGGGEATGTSGGPAVVSSRPSISHDGRFVAFESTASNLVSGDQNEVLDVFLRDRRIGDTERISVSSEGAEAQESSYGSAISGDGRFVVFASTAATFSENDLNGTWDVFVRDRNTDQTKRISTTRCETQANGFSFAPAISASGTEVAFGSGASNLVADDTNAAGDVFVHDRGGTERVSIASDGAQADGRSFNPALSPFGRYVAFTSRATNLVVGDTNAWSDVFVHDRISGNTRRVSTASDDSERAGFTLVKWTGDDWAYSSDRRQSASISVSGRFVAFASSAPLVASDTNQTWDVFVKDINTGETERVSIADDGTQGDGPSFQPSISLDGRYVAFASGATNLVPNTDNNFWDIFVYDRDLDTIERISAIAEDIDLIWSSSPAFSNDGRFVAFQSYERMELSFPSLAGPWQPRTVVYDRVLRLITSEVHRPAIGPGIDDTMAPSISATGQHVAFQAYNENYLPDEYMGPDSFDVFIYDTVAQQGQRVAEMSYGAAISAFGDAVAFASPASTHVPDDTNGQMDVFVAYRNAPTDALEISPAACIE